MNQNQAYGTFSLRPPTSPNYTVTDGVHNNLQIIKLDAGLSVTGNVTITASPITLVWDWTPNDGTTALNAFSIQFGPTTPPPGVLPPYFFSQLHQGKFPGQLFSSDVTNQPEIVIQIVYPPFP